VQILLDGEQRFSCQRCGRCCRAWDVPVLAPEAAALRGLKAERLAQGLDDPARDPFAKVRGNSQLLRLRRRPGGACQFLAGDGRCAIHAELGLRRKPLTCRTFPFRVFSTTLGTIVTASFSCPTIVRNEGESLGAQRKEIERLAEEWRRASAPQPVLVRWCDGRAIGSATLAGLRETLLAVLDRGKARGAVDLPQRVDRLANLVDDIVRPRVVRLAEERFAEYLSVMGRHFAEREGASPARERSALSRLFARGFLFAIIALAWRLDPAHQRSSRLRLWARLAHLLLHLHGLAPAVRGLDFGRVRRLNAPDAGQALWTRMERYLLSSIATLGTGRGDVVTELHVAAAVLCAAVCLAAMRQEGPPDDERFMAALTDAASLDHVAAPVARGIIGWLARSSEPLRAVACWRFH
jgi:Fe-S-cluster containining protein